MNNTKNRRHDEQLFEEQRERVVDEHFRECGAELTATAVPAQARDQQHGQRGEAAYPMKRRRSAGTKQIRQHQHEAEPITENFQHDQGSVHQFEVADCGFLT